MKQFILLLLSYSLSGILTGCEKASKCETAPQVKETDTTNMAAIVDAEAVIEEMHPFKGEWKYEETTYSAEEGEFSQTYYAQINFYEKIDIPDVCTQCYGFYSESNTACGNYMCIDSVLSITNNRAKVQAYNIDYPDQPKKILQFKYNEKDRSLSVGNYTLQKQK